MSSKYAVRKDRDTVAALLKRMDETIEEVAAKREELPIMQSALATWMRKQLQVQKYAMRKERDTVAALLKRMDETTEEFAAKLDTVAALYKRKDETTKEVMAKGEELPIMQSALATWIRKQLQKYAVRKERDTDAALLKRMDETTEEFAAKLDTVAALLERMDETTEEVAAKGEELPIMQSALATWMRKQLQVQKYAVRKERDTVAALLTRMDETTEEVAAKLDTVAALYKRKDETTKEVMAKGEELPIMQSALATWMRKQLQVQQHAVRGTLRRGRSWKIDAADLLKKKDEITKQVMAKVKELPEKQAAQEPQMRKLQAQIRVLEEEKQGLNSKLQVEEAKVESIKKDKATTEKALQEAVESSQAKLAAQKEFYTNALNEAKDAQALAEARAKSEAKTELEHHLHEAGECEPALRQALEELMKEREMRYGELAMREREITRPLMRQIQAMQRKAEMQAEAFSTVERTLNSQIQDAEARAALAEERERAMKEHEKRTISALAVFCQYMARQEGLRPAENQQKYHGALKAAASQECRARQLDEEIEELRNQHNLQMEEERARREHLEQELERERTARLDLENTVRAEACLGSDKNAASKYTNSYLEHGANNHLRRFSSATSIDSMEDFCLKALLDSSSEQALPDRKNTSEDTGSSYFGKSIMPTTLEHLKTILSQKDGKLSSYMARLTSLESKRDFLTEELVKMTNESEKLCIEVAALPAMKAELEVLRCRHTSALELLGERDEELEELRADIADVKQMYREQVDMLVSQIEKLSSSLGSR